MEKENHSTNKSIELLEENKGFCWLKNNYLFIVLFSIIIWIILSLISNDYEIKNIVIKTINDTQNTIDTKTFFSLNQKYLLLSLVSNLFLTFGITLFISMFFSNYFERKERKDFENKLLEFQEQTAKNAYLSLFHQIVDESFFSIVKQDIIQCKKIRLDAK